MFKKDILRMQQNYSDIYRMELGLKNKETGQGFLYAAYYAEHSTKESRRYRDYECATIITGIQNLPKNR